jgi:hypothetical protein
VYIYTEDVPNLICPSRYVLEYYFPSASVLKYIGVFNWQAVRPRRVRVQAVAEPSTLERESQGQAIALSPEVAELPQGAQDAILAAASITAAETPAERQLRKRRAEEKGYRTIGLELPDSVKLSNVVQSIPKEVCTAARLTPCVPRQEGFCCLVPRLCSLETLVHLLCSHIYNSQTWMHNVLLKTFTLSQVPRLQK